MHTPYCLATTRRPEDHILNRRYTGLPPALHAYTLQCRDYVQAFEEKFDCFAMLPLPARPRAVASRTLALPEAVGGGPGVRALCCQSQRHLYTGAYLCEKQGRYGRPARPKRLIGRGWPKLGAA